MKRNALLLVAVATALLATSCSAQSSASPAPATAPAPVSASATATPTESFTPTQETSGTASTVSPSDSSSPITGASVVSSAKGKPGIATDDQMAVIDKVARALANEKYDDAAAAGYYVFDKHGTPVQDATIMASKRKEHADYFNKVKADYAKGGCQLVPVKINESRAIYADMTCNDGSAPDVSIHAQFMNGQLYYIDAIYVNY